MVLVAQPSARFHLFGQLGQQMLLIILLQTVNESIRHETLSVPNDGINGLANTSKPNHTVHMIRHYHITNNIMTIEL
jgi:hypothetical protein